MDEALPCFDDSQWQCKESHLPHTSVPSAASEDREQTHSESGIGSELQQTTGRRRAQIGGSDVQRRAEVKVAAGGVDVYEYESGHTRVFHTESLCCSTLCTESYARTSGSGGLHHHPDQLGNIKVGSVVQRPHVSPA